MTKWFENSRWRNLVDMHIPDHDPEFLSKFSSPEYVGQLEEAHVDCGIVYAGSCLGICYWPAKAGYMHKGLRERDIVSSTIKEMRDKGMKTVVYFNTYNRHEYDRHPDWRMVSINGNQSSRKGDGEETRYGICCFNSEGYKNYMRNMISEITERFEFEGIWIDMVNWGVRVCTCQNCRRRYYEETGREIPEIVDWYDPSWVSFQRKREEWLAEFVNIIDETVRSKKPGASVVYQCAQWQYGWISGINEKFMSAGDYIARDCHDTPLMHTSLCKFMNNATRCRPFELLTACNEGLSKHTTMKSMQELEMSVGTAIAYNAAFGFIDAINPDGTLNKGIYSKFKTLYQKTKKYFDEIPKESVLLRDISFYLNYESFIDVSKNKLSLQSLCSEDALWSMVGRSGFGRKMTNISLQMISRHIAYDITCKNRQDEMLRESRIICVPNQVMLDDDEVRTFTQFAKNGGTLIVTGLSGICDKKGHKHKDFAMAELMGVHFKAESDFDSVYMRPEGNDKLFGDYTEDYPLFLQSRGVLTEAEGDVRVLARLTMPYCDSAEHANYSSVLSNPPGEKTSYPAVTLRKAGKGQVIYIAAPIENCENKSEQSVFANLIEMMTGSESLVETSAPDWLEILAYFDKQAGIYTVYALNVMEKIYSVQAANVKISMRTCRGSVKRIRNIETGEEVAFTEEGGRVSWEIPMVSNLAMFVITIN